MGEPAPAPAELPDQPAVSVPAGFISITPEFLDNKFFHTPSPSENRYVHFRPSSNPRFTIDATSTTGDVEHLYACHPSKMHDELFDKQGRRRFAFPSGIHSPGLDREIRAESVAIGIRTSRSRSKNRDILTLQTVQETLPENIFDEQRPQLSDFELGIKAFAQRVNLFDNQKSAFLHSLEHCRVFDPPRTEYLFETWQASWPERTQTFYRRSLPVFKPDVAKQLYEANEDVSVTPEQWHTLLNQTIKDSFPEREFPDLPAQWPKGVLPFKHRRSFVKAKLMETTISLQKGGGPISGDAVNVWHRFQEVKEDTKKQPIRNSPQDFAVKIPPNSGIQLHPQSRDIRLVNKNATPCDPKHDFPLRHQPFSDGLEEMQITDLNNIGKLTIPLTREPMQRGFEIPPAVLATFDTTIPADVTPVAVPPPGGPVGNESEPVHRLRDNEGRIWEVYDKDEKFSFSKERDDRGKFEPTHLGVLQCHKGKPYVFLRSKSNNNHWREAYAEEFASGKLFSTLQEQVKMRDNREWVRSDGSPWPIRFPLDGGIPFVSPKQPPPVQQPPAQQPLAPQTPAQQPKQFPAVQPVAAEAASPSAPIDPGSKASPATPSSPDIYFRRMSCYLRVDTTKRYFDEFSDVSNFSDITPSTPPPIDINNDSQPETTRSSRGTARSRSPRGDQRDGRLGPPPILSARAKSGSGTRSPTHPGNVQKPKPPAPPSLSKGKRDNSNSPKGRQGFGQDQGKGVSPSAQGMRILPDYGKGKHKSDQPKKGYAPTVDWSQFSKTTMPRAPPGPYPSVGMSSVAGPPPLASTGGFPVSSGGFPVPFDPSFGKGFPGPPQPGPGVPPPPPSFGGKFGHPSFPAAVLTINDPAILTPKAHLGGFSAVSSSSMVPGVRPSFTASGFSSSGPPLPAGPPPSFASSSAFMSPALSETSTLNALTTPTDMRDQSVLTMDDPDPLSMPSPALSISAPTPPVGPTVRPKPAAQTITLGSGNSASGPAFAAHIPAYKDPPPPPAPPPKPKPPPTPGGYPFGAVHPSDRASQQ